MNDEEILKGLFRYFD